MFSPINAEGPTQMIRLSGKLRQKFQILTEEPTRTLSHPCDRMRFYQFIRYTHSHGSTISPGEKKRKKGSEEKKGQEPFPAINARPPNGSEKVPDPFFSSRDPAAGEVPEWPNGPVSKTGVPSGTVGSNPTLSVSKERGFASTLSQSTCGASPYFAPGHVPDLSRGISPVPAGAAGARRRTPIPARRRGKPPTVPALSGVPR